MSTLTTEKTCQVLLAMKEPRIRAAAMALLGEQQWQVHHIEHAHDILFGVHQYKPQVLLIDLDMPLSDMLSIIKVLRRNPQTTGTQILATCAATMDRQGLVELATAGAAGVLIKPLSGAVILQKIKHCLAQPQPAAIPSMQKGENSARQVPGNPSLLMRRLACPFHDNPPPTSTPTSTYNTASVSAASPPEFWYYTLRSGKINTEVSFFDIPVYVSALPGASFVDYHLLAVATCPVCFFASNNPDYFLHPHDPRHEKFAFDPAIHLTLKAGSAARRAKVPVLGPHFMDEQRPLADALLTYQAALVTAQQLYDCDNHIFAIELVRMGNYHLRIAQLLEKSMAPINEIVAEYEKAVAILKNAYVYIQGAPFYRNIYQIVAILIYLNQDQEAYQYLGRLKEIEQTPSHANLSSPDRTTLSRYLGSCQKAWEDRSYHRCPS